MDSKALIETLALQPHPEGGYFRETYRSTESIPLLKNRNVSTAIYFLLEEEQFSAFHRIQSDELWFFHQGAPLEIVSIQQGKLTTILLGNDIEKAELPQAIIPAKTWFASRIKSGSGYALVSCTVAPGFDFADFEMAKREELIAEYPELEESIIRFTRT